MHIQLACAFATSASSHEHARIAEDLGYERCWFYDSPALYPDVWVQLCRAAERTKRIGLATGVLIPSLRHPMTTAAAVATLAGIAGEERVAVGVGSGFTGRLTMGQRPLRWAYVREYVRVVRALLRGEDAEWQGKTMRMLHPAGYGAARPIRVPFVIAAAGPKGLEAAREVEGVITAWAAVPGFAWSTVITTGTVLEPGESPGSARAIAAAGHSASVSFHYAAEHGLLEGFPRAEEWLAAYREVPERVRHLEMHDQHLIAVNERDRPFVTGALLQQLGLAGSEREVRARLEGFAAAGATEVAYQPAGPDVPRELAAFAKAARG